MMRMQFLVDYTGSCQSCRRVVLQSAHGHGGSARLPRSAGAKIRRLPSVWVAGRMSSSTARCTSDSVVPLSANDAVTSRTWLRRDQPRLPTAGLASNLTAELYGWAHTESIGIDPIVGAVHESLISSTKNHIMKSILISSYAPDPSLLSPTDIPTPSPGRDEYLVRITHCSPQHADILHAQGKHQNNNPKRGWCFPPFTLGYDFAGIIQSVPEQGSKADLRKGDRVFGQSIGAFAEYICPKAGFIRKVPDELSNETACAMAGQAVSYAAVAHVAKVRAGETVMVSGASGGLGSVCCMVAKALGAKVIALAGDEEKARHMREDMDVDLVVVQKGDWISEVQTFTGGQGLDVMLDNTGMVNDALRCVAYFGRVVILGFAARKGIMEDVKMNKLLLKSITVTGYRFGESGRRYPEDLQRIWDGYLSMMKSGQLKPLLYGKYEGLKDVGRALKDLAERKVYGKIVIKVAEDVVNSRL